MNLADPAKLKPFLARHGIVASKGLGQHFLCSERVVEAIGSRFEGLSGLLEIGPGPGVLTSALAPRVEAYVALEIDERMRPLLLESAPGAEILLGDALAADLTEILAKLPRPRGLVSNLPYYITGPLLTRIADASDGWDRAVLMMQTEVAARVTAPPGDSDRGSLSVYLQAQFAIDTVIEVSPGAFWPPPKVSSTVLEFVPLRTRYSPAFFDFVRAGFKQPRKTLVNNLIASGKSRDEAVGSLLAAGLDERARPHALTLNHWLALAAIFGVG